MKVVSWYLVPTKPRQEKTALINLELQGYECYLPMLSAEKLRQRVLSVIDEPLFPRYLFIRLDKRSVRSLSCFYERICLARSL